LVFLAFPILILIAMASCSNSVRLHFNNGPSKVSYGDYKAVFPSDLEYDNGRVYTDEVVVTLDSVELKKGTDYTVRYNWIANNHMLQYTSNPTMNFPSGLPKGRYGVACIGEVSIGETVLRVYRYGTWTHTL